MSHLDESFEHDSPLLLLVSMFLISHTKEEGRKRISLNYSPRKELHFVYLSCKRNSCTIKVVNFIRVTQL